MKDIFKVFRKKPEKKEFISSILKVTTKNAEDLSFVIPNISCVGDVKEEPDKNYSISIHAVNKTQLFFDSKTKANNTHKKILNLIEKWWELNG